MTKPLTDAVRRAKALISSGGLMEATRAIQEALAGGGAPSAARPADEHRGPTIEHDGPAEPDRSRARARTDAKAPKGVPDIAQAVRAGLQALPAKLGSTLAGTPLGRLGEGLAPSARRPASPLPDGAGFTEHRHDGPEGSLEYKLYVPANLPAGPRPLVVMLHGCTQDPDDFAAGTRMNALAESEGLIVAYPRQNAKANPQKCWNWFSPDHQYRGKGEPAVIAAIAARLADEHDIDPGRVFAAGLSAGGAMAAILGAIYPDVFAAVGVHSGLPQGAASDVMSALQVMRNGRSAPVPVTPEGTPARMIVFHGTADQTVHPANGDRLAQGIASAGRPAVKSGRIDGRSYVRSTAAPSPGAPPRLEYWQVEGLGHAWSGGSSDGSYADDTGPDASREMLRFFLR